VTSAPSGPAALAAHAPGGYDVVLTNLGMAGMNGWEFAERLRSLDPSVAILFITGWGLREEDQGRLEKLRVRRCLFKPVRPSDLDAAIQEALV
jgi:CheY-like chemotaxis protein